MVDPALARGRECTWAFLYGDLLSVWRAMTPEMRLELGDVHGFVAFRQEVEGHYGSEDRLVSEEVHKYGLYDVYLRTARWTGTPSAIAMQWAFDDAGRIAGFLVRVVRIAAESRFLDYRPRATLSLPFADAWHVLWGGRTIEQNHHAADKAQRFALDFVICQEGTTYSGDPAQLRSYFCWNQPILAPAAGIVVLAVDGQSDQPIGTSDAADPAGNHVVLRLGAGEFAVLAHLRNGSLAVGPGDEVGPGQELGRCGNSGNSTEPHLHFHLQTTPDLGSGEGLPSYFTSYHADGMLIDAGEPSRGQVVSPSAPGG